MFSCIRNVPVIFVEKPQLTIFIRSYLIHTRSDKSLNNGTVVNLIVIFAKRVTWNNANSPFQKTKNHGKLIEKLL